MSHRGQIFEQEISKSLRNLDQVWYFRFPQMKHVIHPFDHLALSPNGNYALELKKTEQKSLPLSELKDKQINSLLWFQRLKNNRSLVLINYRRGRGKIRAFALNIEEFLRAKNIMLNKRDRKSIPIDYCEDNKRIKELDRIKIKDQYGWDLEFLHKCKII